MDSFFIIVGLGNPGRKYDGSRHNIGFDVIDELVDRYHIGGPERFGKSMIGKGRIGDRKVILVKPLTYMNLSGEAVQEIVHYYRVDPAQDLVVISDDIDLEAGRLRIRKKGSAGGHNGLKSIVQHLGTDEFARIRVGVGAKPDADYDLADFVLGHFSSEERKVMDEAAEKAAEAVACMVTDGADLAMNRYNTPRKKKKTPKKPVQGEEQPQEPGDTQRQTIAQPQADPEPRLQSGTQARDKKAVQGQDEAQAQIKAQPREQDGAQEGQS